MKPIHALKKVALITILVSTLLLQATAHANCSGDYFEGIFNNDRGDHFKFEQPDCDHLVITDLQTKDVFNAEQGTFSLQAKPVSNGFVGFTMSHLPISIRLGQRMEQNGYAQQEVDFRITVPMDSSQGLSNPTLEASVMMYAWNEDPSYNNGVRGGLSIDLNGNVHADHLGAETSVQWGFIEGINFGLNLLKSHVSYNDYLVRF